MLASMGGTRKGRDSWTETLAAVQLLRAVMRPAYPVALFSDVASLVLLSRSGSDARAESARLWDMHRPARVAPQLRQLAGALPREEASSMLVWVHKLSVLLDSPYGERTLYLDSDVWVLQAGLVHLLLSHVLDHASWAQPLDPYRHRTLRDSPLPPLCACMIAFRGSNATRELVAGAARRLILRDPPSTLRRTDQEYLTVELLSGAHDVRLNSLPEEWFCPGVPHSASAPAVWRTPWPWSTYPCKAVHGRLGELHPLHVEPQAASQRRVTTGRGSTTTRWEVAQVPTAIRQMAEGVNATPRWYTFFSRR